MLRLVLTASHCLLILRSSDDGPRLGFYPVGDTDCVPSSYRSLEAARQQTNGQTNGEEFKTLLTHILPLLPLLSLRFSKSSFFSYKLRSKETGSHLGSIHPSQEGVLSKEKPLAWM